MSREDDLLYWAESLAFEGTPLWDDQDRTSLIEETKELATSAALRSYCGVVHVEEASARLATSAAYARGQLIRFAPTRMSRYVAAHELAHVVHRRSDLGGTSHGPEYKAIYAEVIGIAYGLQYRDVLWQAYNEMGLYVHPARLAVPDRPVIDIDRLSDLSGGKRWL